MPVNPFLSNLLPALGVSGVKFPAAGAAGHRRTATAPGLQFALAAFLELVTVPISLNFICPKVCQSLFKNIAHPTVLYPAAGIDISRGQYGKMAVAAVAAAINHIRLSIIRNLEPAHLIIVKGPKMVFAVEIGLATSCFIVMENLIAICQ